MDDIQYMMLYNIFALNRFVLHLHDIFFIMTFVFIQLQPVQC